MRNSKIKLQQSGKIISIIFGGGVYLAKNTLRPQTCGEAVRCSGLHSQMRAQRSGSHLKRVDFVDTLTALPGFPAERWFLFVKSPEGFFVFGG